jgi:hypothetical protein
MASTKQKGSDLFSPKTSAAYALAALTAAPSNEENRKNGHGSLTGTRLFKGGTPGPGLGHPNNTAIAPAPQRTTTFAPVPVSFDRFYQ